MSLRLRLVLLIVVLVGLVVVALSGLYVDSLVNALSAGAIDRSRLASQQIYSFLLDQLNQHVQEHALPLDDEGMRELYYEIATTDEDIAPMLVKMQALSDYIVEINVAGANRQILASSNPNRIGETLTTLQDFGSWKDLSLVRRVSDLVFRRPDYQVLGNFAVEGRQQQTVFTVQVVTSSVFLRAALLPQLQRLALVLLAVLVATLLITVVATNRILLPVRRIEQTIDRIAQGSFGNEKGGRGLAKEFAVVETKLNLLGEQYRGARDHATELRHDIDSLLERMASQLDVASRLAAISKLTGGVAHEIKNPLNAIALRLDLLRAKLGAPEEELIQEIDILSKEVLRLDRVVKTFLDFSRPVEVHFQEVDLSALVKEVMDLMAPQGKLAGITLELDTPAEPAHLRADPDMIKQAVLNLVTNAMEAMKNGGLLRVKVAQGEGAVILEVADSGPGIPAELRDKVFQLYFTTKARGSGIGLAMTYRAVQLHNGTIAFTSDEGRGTTFRLQFPAVVHHA